MAHFIKSGDIISVVSQVAYDIGNTLPPDTYIVKHNPKQGFWLEMIDSFSRIPKYYGNTEKHSNRILNTYFARNKTTGVMLAGEKGSGKTLLAKLVCIEALEKGLPVIIVNSPFVNQQEVQGQATTGDDFIKFIQTIDQPCVIFFDEFEKIYKTVEDQHSILTMLDGVFSSNKLFVLTCNDKSRIDKHLKNRPGRLHYMFDFSTLEMEFIKDYLDDKLIHKHHYDAIVKLSTLFVAFNFDMLQAIVEECNRYDEDPKDLIKILNTKPQQESNPHESFAIIDVYVDGNPLAKNCYYGSSVYNLYERDNITLEMNEEVYLGPVFNVSTKDIIRIDNSEGIYEFGDPEGDRIVLKRSMRTPWDYSKLF